MGTQRTESDLAKDIHNFITDSFEPHFDQLDGGFKTDPIWRRMRDVGSELWLDTGSIDDAEMLWTREFSALTTNNTLLNREVQSGRYDSLILEAAKILDGYEQLTADEHMLEIAFILNAWHGLRLVEKFDAYVSVEEHTALAHETELAVEYARRFYNICPQRFIIKIPFTPAGLLATRKIAAEGIRVNHTLGFSARQNYLIARIGKPNFVNVFLGRLNSFVAGNELGDGSYVGEKATLASQAAVKNLRQQLTIPTRQIGASFRSGQQVVDLAGIDVMTMPPKVAGEFLAKGMSPEDIAGKTKMHYQAGVNDPTEAEAVRVDTLWKINDELITCIEAIEKEDIDSFTPDDLIDFFDKNNCADVLVRWSEEQIATSRAEGKIPKLENWRKDLESKAIGLDSLMNLAGLNSFAADQKAMDDRVREVLGKS